MTMRAPVRLGLYGAVLVAVFAMAFTTAGAVVPEETVQSWSEEAVDHGGEHPEGEDPDTGDLTGGSDSHGATAGPDAHVSSKDPAGVGGAVAGLSLESGGYRLSEISAPLDTVTGGDLVLTVAGPDGQPVADFDLSHEKELHLIVVGTDGSGFRHVHPERDADDQWSIPWQWQEAGSYRVYAEFVPAATGEVTTLSTVVQVKGEDSASTLSEPVSTSETDGYEVSIDGDLSAGDASAMTITITRDGEPVTELEPYLGAYGHLVALREGDLAYLHVHPRGEKPEPGQTSGPRVAFDVTAPTPGRYLLYLDFQTGGQVHTAEFVLDADAGSPVSGDEGTSQDEGDDHHTTEQEEGDDHDHGK